ncbi:hypothetical protein [Candidatus Phytoplasma pruni]|uniref:Uncharacterized protein n=1 Tax=Candidatus Phytoplasma pruni TaxID=479893 RepID=A0A851HC47_9MOLU|nr:hypothetical protein [Candidatus Phytoplasma pruni]NWN45568.1 hypothetical protein [Candidatus Phytoplasma pruni]
MNNQTYNLSLSNSESNKKLTWKERDRLFLEYFNNSENNESRNVDNFLLHHFKHEVLNENGQINERYLILRTHYMQMYYAFLNLKK